MNYFAALIKPASSLCNMRCRYCFYYDVATNRDVASYGIMSIDTAKALIGKAFAHVAPPAQITFTFQGGEPTMAGLSFFQQFIEEVRCQTTDGYQIHYSIQTNGQVVDDEWCRFFHQHKFLVGLSLDGPKEIHDKQRFSGTLKGTFAITRKSMQLLRRHKVAFNILTVLTQQAARHATALYRFYEKEGIDYAQIIPCLRPLNASESHPFDLGAKEYAQFLKDFFSLWYENLKKGTYISVRQFDNLVWMLRGQPAEQCGLMGFCSPQYVIEANGNVYPCDFYVLDQYMGGNVHTHSFAEIWNSPGTKKFLEDTVKEQPLCQTCQVKPLCGGGCKRYRSFYASLEGYCPYQDFLMDAYSRLVEISRNT